MLKRRDVVALGFAALSAPAFGQSHYPDRPIRLVGWTPVIKAIGLKLE